MGGSPPSHFYIQEQLNKITSLAQRSITSALWQYNHEYVNVM